MNAFVNDHHTLVVDYCITHITLDCSLTHLFSKDSRNLSSFKVKFNDKRKSKSDKT